MEPPFAEYQQWLHPILEDECVNVLVNSCDEQYLKKNINTDPRKQSCRNNHNVESEKRGVWVWECCHKDFLLSGCVSVYGLHKRLICLLYSSKVTFSSLKCKHQGLVLEITKDYDIGCLGERSRTKPILKSPERAADNSSKESGYLGCVSHPGLP